MTPEQIQNLVLISFLFVFTLQVFHFLGKLILLRLDETRDERRQLRLVPQVREERQRKLQEARQAAQEAETKAFPSRTLPGAPPLNSRRSAAPWPR